MLEIYRKIGFRLIFDRSILNGFLGYIDFIEKIIFIEDKFIKYYRNNLFWERVSRYKNWED